ncbi:hypothetical protein HUT19_00490 [Streptomyces sp. NA02950]|uniref:hypothetical protein n=1 Tax=Streptomyces sp. NA02950 TaxID=2742137 RepID=UPI0015918E17|nr:hypothetical protein [Streptomyces sp. NA02950]QKV90451.1 hypothetical protein HUT19_00490 [Streptomyces sp. NA02950]
MANLKLTEDLRVHVTYYSWCFQESDESRVPVEYPDESAADSFLSEFQGRFDILSAGHTHTANVAVEVWDAVPPPDERQRWDFQAEVDFESTSGEVAVWTEGRDHSFQLTSPGTWRVRVHCSGRTEVERISQEEGVADGIEQYLVQFWPTS